MIGFFLFHFSEMFEAHVLYLLQKYLGEYVEGLSIEALRISVWKGDVVLKDLRLKTEALNLLKLPVTVKAGFVGTITLQVPWKSLGKEPVVVLIDRVFVLAEPAPDGQTLTDQDREKLFESKLHQIEEAETATIEASIRRDKAGAAPSGNSWLGSLIATIIGNLKVTISNVHIRYEDSISNPGHPFCSGITLSKLAAVTTDEQGNETFDTSGALDKLRKSLQLLRLAIYHDSDSVPWEPGKSWKDMNPADWTEMFQDGIGALDGNKTASLWANDRRYLVSPINGILKYHRIGKQERLDSQIPFEKASLVLSDVSLTVSEAQYYDGIKLLEAVSRYRTRVEVSHLRPVVPIFEDPHAWWRYAMLASLQQKKLCYWFSWERIMHLCQLRRRYVHIYANSLQQTSSIDISEMRQIERDLDSKVILLWRLLAHAKLESVKSKEASQQKGAMRRSWWSFGWSNSSEVSSVESISAEPQLAEEDRLIKEEWQAINKLLSYQPDEDTSSSPIGKDMQNMIQVLVDVSIGKAAASIVNINQIEIVCGSFEQLNVTTKMYHKSIHCNVSLKCYGLSSPEGQLSQSVSSERKTNALEASFVHAPVGEDVDWRLSATIAPCHVTILMESYERFIEFVKRSNAVSPTVTMETATALQMKIERVTRKAQEQLQMVLEEKSRFSLDVDIDAPKVRIPMRPCQSLSWNSQFLLDFGHFTLHTMEGQHDEQKQNLYSRFYISGRDMAAIFVDGECSGSCVVTAALENQVLPMGKTDGDTELYSLLDHCGMSVIIDQIKIPHPRHPSTRISVQVPNLGMHFSPERYSRILKLLNIFYGSSENIDQNSSVRIQTGHVPWLPMDLGTDARILVWKGFGHSLAEWKPCYVVLSGLYLYVLETQFSQTYQRCCSVSGRQVLEVSPSSIGGLPFAIALSSRGIDIQKALESVNTLIIAFRDSDEKNIWSKELVQATYRASAPPAVNILGEQTNNLTESSTPRHGSTGLADLVISGSLVETKLSIYGKYDGNCGSLEEVLILELLGSGGKVNLFRSSCNLTVKTKLHSLKIVDELQGRLSTPPQYLARSVLKENFDSGVDTELNNFFLEEDDCFADALPDFMSTTDQTFHNSLRTPDSFDQYSGDGTSSSNLEHVKERSEIFYETWDSNMSDFVAVTFVSRSPDSSLYDGIDTQMRIRMSALELFCNRPTLVTLIGFCFELSQVNSEAVKANNSDDVDIERKDDNGCALVKGLLGYGKGRVVFNLVMDIDSVCVFLNKEDGSQLAMFVQESFILNLKFHPSSTTIEGTLGNMRLCDMSLGPDHRWGWLCDIRNQGIESLIKFKFQSYTFEDDDYEGYDYSLSGRLSAVRIVFLYRFVLEITSYFMGLATPHTEEAIKLVDKVGGIEWLIQKYELDGATALKLDLSLDTPLIIVPKNSMSEDFMQLDLGQLQVKNNFNWYGSKDKDPSAVHLDILDAEIQGVNMAVGVSGRLGKLMVREAQDLHIQVRRSLRDVFSRVPTLSIEVQVGLLHCIMSDKEYNVIINCLSMNLSEVPRLPPSFRGNVAGAKESMRMLVDKVNLNGQILLSRTIVVIAVEIHYALLELCNGVDEESPLAQISLEGLWVYYRSTSFFEMDLYVTIPKFSVLDIRPNTKPEMRLMLGSYTDISKPGCNNLFSSASFLSSQANMQGKLENVYGMDVSNLTMLVLDYRWRSSFRSFVIRIQQPRVLVVLDFLLAVAEFFVPSLGTITGREETLHPNKDPLTSSDDIILSESVYMQHDDVVHLSPRRQLIVDGCNFDEFIYDGCGHTLSLSDEFDSKGQSYSGTIIILGHGKKLRFKNVKIENGALLRKRTYLSSDSSYSISVDDGVEISLLDKDTSEIDGEGSKPCQDSLRDTNIFDLDFTSATSQSQNFTFEAQVVSPEFTFYDSSKLASDNPLHVEKLLRARMDLRFMYASKENDTWARALVKDFTIDAGSGVVILEPMDISGGYTSVKDKTSISMLSSDICIHLSLSVASLLLKLQNQAIEAFQFGKVNPLVSCTNFRRIWVSTKGELPGQNLTFWRPQAPSNYAVLGDCVTSRPVPPTQVVVAVSNAYGRVRKPLGFKLVASFSNFQDLSGGNPSESSADCSIWLPIPPPGYSAVGCVAHVGIQQPPNHIIHCLRADLVTSTAYSDCILYVPPQPRFVSGFSIWHVDNVLGSFYAHCSVGSPPKNESFDLHQILLRNPNWHLSAAKNSDSASGDYDQQSQQSVNSSNTSSGWDILRSLSRTNYYMSTPHFERIWWDKGSDFRRPISIWRPIPRQGFATLGDCITEGLEPPALGLVFKCDNSMISAKPVQFSKVAHAVGKGFEDAFFWYPIPPPGYASLGCVVTRKDEAPQNESLCCPRIDLINQTNVSEEPISRSSSSKGPTCWSIWKVENQAYTFLARSDLRRPSSRLAYTISDSVKPKTRENISAEMKLGCFSLTVLDSFLGTMTPVIDTTITNINLATHGGLEAMNAVLICSIAASTFNRQLESWEPLVEPFDGIFKLETYDTSELPPSKIGKRIRIAATSSLNLNVSAANLETLIETIVSWERQNDLDQKLSKKAEEAGEVSKNPGLSFSALDEDDFQKVIIENKLGRDIYVRKIEEISEEIELLQNDSHTSLLVPPPRFSDRLNVITKFRETRYYVTIQIFESKGLPINDDGNKQDYFCALRLLIDTKVSDQYKLFPQSARTRCVRPSVSKINDMAVGYAKWNELFIFEVPEKGSANLEVEVTNLSAKAGKGEVIGALSVPLGRSSNTLKRAASVRMLQHAVVSDAQNILTYALRRKVHNPEGDKDSGLLVISTTYFERNIDANFQRGIQSTSAADRDVGFWIGLGPEGPWESFSSVLPLSLVPKSLHKNPFAFEVVMRNGRKHAILRALAVIKNETDIKLEVSVCPSSKLSSLLNIGRADPAVVTEEVFENQRYQPISGWGNKSTLHGDPEHWSTRNFSYSSKEFFEPTFPSSGWRWNSPWRIDKSEFVDSDGWAYGTDFQSLKWPPTSSKSSSKSALHFVRRRLWTRNRQQIPEKNIDSMRNVIAVIDPTSSTVLPWASMARDSDLFLQVRPYVENSQELYVWGQAVAMGSSKDVSASQLASVTRLNSLGQPNSLNSFLKLNSLQKNDVLLCCNPCISSKQNIWLSVGTDASVLHTELNAPVYDWKISINSVLKLENKLPYEAEYAVWEKTIHGNMVERQHGILFANGSSFISSADIRRPIYLTLFVQGGWILEKEAILIMDLLNLDHASSFWIIQQQSKRKVRVSVEYDMGGTDAAPKIVRLFVPYWIRNDSSVPLSYRIVEVDTLDNLDTDSPSSKPVKSAKFALKHSSKSIDRKYSCSRRNIEILEIIDDFNPNCVILSPQDYIGRDGASSFSSHIDALSSARVGISVAVHHSEHYSPGISLVDLERKERVDVKAFSSDGSYFKLSAQLKMSSDRTKVVSFLPHTLFVNRVGRILYLFQYDAEFMDCLRPTDPPKILKWQSSYGKELLKLRLDGYSWSTPFSIESSGVMCICIKKDNGNEQLHLRVEVRSGMKSSRYEVVFRLFSYASPYRIENRSLFLPVHFRQVGCNDGCWHSLLPNSAASFSWEDLGRPHLLEVLVDGADPIKTREYNIDEVKDHQPMQASSGPTRALRLTVLKEGKLQIARMSDWMPDDDIPIIMQGRVSLPVFEPSENDYKQSSSDLDSELHITFELAELGLSITDHMPEEILYLSIQSLLFSYSSGLGSGISRLKLRMNGAQVDNQLPFTPMPVLFGPQKVGDQLDYVLKFSMTLQTNNSLDFCEYPYVGFQVPDNSAFLVNIHEPIIWRLHELFQQVKFGGLFGSTDSAVSVDPIIKIRLLNISEVRFKVSMAMSPSQRPRGVLGFWSSLMTALGNTEHMQIRIGQKYREEVCMRQSALINTAISSIQKDLLSHPLQLLSGVDILGNASSALSNMSKGVAALSMDKKFIQSRQKQDSKTVEDFGDVIREGGGALAKGFFRGVTGILTKPLEGAKSSGVEGFVQGVGKGIIGAAAQPVSGVLDLLSKTTEGANAMRMKIASAITSEEQLLRRRLPRVIGGDNLLRPYDAYKATGQVILQLAESGTFFGQVDLFKVRGKFALSDAYEDHFLLPKGKILLVTHRRVLLLQQPINIMAQRKFNPARDPCSVLWDVLWEDLVTMELTHGKKDNTGSPTSRLILYLQIKSPDSKENVRMIKCTSGSQQANEIFSSIQEALIAYGPNASKDNKKRKVARPYTPSNDASFSEVFPKEVYGSWGVQDAEESAQINSSFGTVLPQLQPMK